MKKNSVGQSMVEAVVAVGIVLLLVTGLIVATTSTLKYVRMSKDRTRALQYAKEGLEIVRIIKDAGWDNIPQDLTNSYCLSKDQQDLTTVMVVTCPYDIDSQFSRTIVFSNEGTCTAVQSCRKVTVTVSWMEEALRSVSLSTYVTNWRGVL